jgi:uncharacterized protein YraI
MGTPARVRLLFGVCLLGLSAAAAAQNAVTTGPVSVYAGPDDSYPPVAQLDADSPVQVMGCLDDWSWCDVAFADNRGWLYAPDITYEYEGGYVPLYTYAPGLGIPVVQFTIGDYWGRYYHGRPWYARRDEWVHREPAHHRRPPGPPPSAGPPPRSARVERPSHAPQPERPLQLGRAGSAEPAHREAERRDGPRDSGGVKPPDPHAAEHIAPPQPAHESHSGPGSAERAVPAPRAERPPERPSAHEQPQRHQEPPRQAEPPRHDAKPAERPGERPNDSPH